MSTESVRETAEILDRIYAAAFDAEAWSPAIDLLGRSLHDTGVLFGIHDEQRTRSANVLAFRSLTADVVQRFQRDYGSAATNPLIPTFGLAPVNVPFRFEAYYSASPIADVPHIRELCIPNGMVHFLNVTLARSGDLMVPLSLIRRRDQGDFDADDVRWLEQIVPHLGRAARAFVELQAARATGEIFEEVLDLLSCAVALVDPDGRAITMNRRAERLVRAGSGIRTEHGRLEAGQRRDRARFRDALRRAAGRRGHRRAGHALTLTRAFDEPPLACLILPVGGASAGHFGSRAAALLILKDPRDDDGPDPGTLARLYDLSPRQAQLVGHLLRGKRLGDAARKMGITPHSARTHLERILLKTGTGSRADLQRLIAAGPAGLVGRPQS